MPDSGGPPQCNPACQKIILDGDLLGAIFSTTGERLSKFQRKLNSAERIAEAFHETVFASYEFIRLVREAISANEVPPLALETPMHMATVIEETCALIEAFRRPIPNGIEVVHKLIAAEDLAFKWQRNVLIGMGYQGPFPHCLSNPAA